MSLCCAEPITLPYTKDCSHEAMHERERGSQAPYSSHCDVNEALVSVDKLRRLIYCPVIRSEPRKYEW